MRIDLSRNGIEIKQESMDIASKWQSELAKGDQEFTGWANLPSTIDKDMVEDIKQTAKEIKEKCDLFVVIGIGGSYLGAQAVIDALDGSKEDYPEVMFAGYNMSATTMNKVVKAMEEKETCICVISKSGGTVEPLMAYSILKEKLIEKYGEAEADKRIYVVTDAVKGTLRPEVEAKGYKSFVIPDNVGGRYSVLTPVGLLPIAAAGADIDALLKGAKDMEEDEGWKDELLKYAISRVELLNSGKVIEVFEYFEDTLRYFGEWIKQLFGESEGKEGKGAYPACLCFSRDLHSIGQFLQQGNPIVYETVIRIDEPNLNFTIPEIAGDPYAGKTLEDINRCAEGGVILAHEKAGVPINTISIEKLDEYNLGQMIYFFEMTCGIAASMQGVNPFDQPGVEGYKSEMRKLINEL
ncbi:MULTISPECIES: glucose-6-phosphate isomerase [Anaerofustis]|uniref:glucose-6-phosphate isomerase n=1 Tax=Anaerofustis TaxID=264995 RepID=UPI001106EDC8|nr:MULTISPECIES: glucose-6-phosphate isomerase [Anaerofustis]MCO8194775.1 glucose-6-phosphate isomerase [Anaerofustis sp. NSJ-163]